MMISSCEFRFNWCCINQSFLVVGVQVPFLCICILDSAIFQESV